MKQTNFTKQLAFFILLAIIFSPIADLSAQGCVAIRGLSGCSGNVGEGAIIPKGNLLVGANFRYFKSFRHFSGDHEHTHRVEQGKIGRAHV